MNLTLSKKMLYGYLATILLPMLVFGLLYLRLSTTTLVAQYQAGLQNLLEQNHANYKTRVLQTESFHRMLQNSKPLIQYLSGFNRTAADEVYSYLTDIRPLFSLIEASGDIQLAVYHSQNVKVPLSNDIFQVSSATPSMETLEAESGSWHFSPGVATATYTARLYGTGYSRVVGYLRITVGSSELLEPFINPGENEDVLMNLASRWYSLAGSRVLPLRQDAPLTVAALNALSFSAGVRRQYIVNFLYLEELDAHIALVTPSGKAVAPSRNLLMLLLFLGILGLLSLLYYTLVNSLSRRLIHLYWHIRKTDVNHMIPHDDVGYTDEVGDVIRAFNKMIVRIRDLLSDLNIAELKKREADFYALQAQIKPHFIYNALETVRMTAEANDDSEAADLSYNLGRFIRYSLSSGGQESTLQREMENVESFLQIYKGSLGERLQYTLHMADDILQVQCPAFLLQPLVENSIHHGMHGRGQPLKISLHGRRENGFAVVTVADDGVGIGPARRQLICEILAGQASPDALPQTQSGIGIANVLHRLDVYYSGRAGLVLEEQREAGTTWTLTIPIEEGKHAAEQAH